MGYHHIESLEDYYLLHTTADRSIILYTATWCGPCKELKAFLHDQYPDPQVPILIVDVDDQELSDLIGDVQGMPTLEFYSEGKRVEKIEGFRKILIQKMLEEWMV
jgi:thioredoxin 1